MTAVRPGVIDRASDADLAFLAMDDARPPEQFAIVLVLDAEVSGTTVEHLLAGRIAGVPRLRQRLTRTPPGCGRAIWVDDEAFDLRRHVSVAHCDPPGDDDALLRTAVPLVMAPLPRERPLWRAVVIHGLAGDRTALLLITHHVLADGLGGLAVLEKLLDGRPLPPVPGMVRARPPALLLAADAMRARWDAIRTTGAKWRSLRTSMSAGGGLAPPRAQPCSLVHPAGRRRAAVVVRTDLDALRETAHRSGGTVNAALLTAVARALVEVLRYRRESIAAVVMAVPVAGARPDDTGPGNAVSPLLVTVPASGSAGQQLREVARVVRSRRALATEPAPIAVLGKAFRLAATLGAYRWYMRRQRRLHTLVSYVRGPASAVRVAGATVDAMIPLVIGGSTNLTVTFQAISYAGTLSVTVIADPDHCPDLPYLAGALRRNLDELTARRLVS